MKGNPVGVSVTKGYRIKRDERSKTMLFMYI